MKIGLAFGGGGVRGLAHLGVLSVLLEAGIPIDYVSGCSAGSVIGAAFCTGISIERMEAVTRFLKWRRLARPVRSKASLVSFDRLERWFVMLFGDPEFADLERPLAVVAMDAENGQRVVLTEGRVAKAVHASCSVPPIVEPVKINGRLLVDGGIVDNLPSEAVRDFGADYVIGVDVFQPNYRRKAGRLGAALTVLETLVRNAGGGIAASDFLITPETARSSFFRFSDHQELISLGKRAASENLPAILEDIDRKKKGGLKMVRESSTGNEA